MAGRSILGNAAFTLLGQLGARLLALAFYAVLARVAGRELYGAQGVGAALGTLFVVLVEPGLNPLLVRDVARDPASAAERVGMLLGYKLLALGVAWPLCVGTGWLLGYRDDVLWAVVFAGGTILVGGLEDFGASVLAARERLDLEGALRFSSKVLTAGLGLVAMAGQASFSAVLAAVCAGASAAGVVGLVLVRRAGVPVTVRVRPVETLGHLRDAWPLALHNVLWLVTLRLDQVLAGELGVPAADLGGYNASVKLLEALVMFPVAVSLAFQPVMARAAHGALGDLSQRTRQALAATWSACLPVTVGGALLAPGLVTLVYGEAYAPAGPLFAVQLVALPLLGIQSVASAALVAVGRTRGQALATVCNLVVNVAVNVALVPRVGIVGASWAAVSGGAAACAVYAVLLGTHRVRPGWLASSWRAGVASAAMGGALWALGGVVALPVLAGVGVGAMVYAGVFLAVGGAGIIRELRAARAG